MRHTNEFCKASLNKNRITPVGFSNAWLRLFDHFGQTSWQRYSQSTFGPNVEANLIEDWRPANPVEAVLTTCSTLIAIIEDQNSKIVQFSHFSVKEFLTSDRLLLSDIENICQFYVPPELAHTILARACLTVLLRLDEEVDKMRLSTLPLAFYAAQHWVDHAKFEKVASQIQDSMERLFNPKDPYFRAWIWIFDVQLPRTKTMDDLSEHPSAPSRIQTPLYCAVYCGLIDIARHLITAHGEDVNANRGLTWSPLHLASSRRTFDVVRGLLDLGAT